MMPPSSPRRASLRQALDQRAQHALEERLLELELLERLRLDDQLLESGLDGVLRRAPGEPVGDQQDGDSRQAGENDFSAWHLRLHLDVDDAADEHVPDAHADQADGEEDDSGGNPNVSGGRSSMAVMYDGLMRNRIPPGQPAAG